MLDMSGSETAFTLVAATKGGTPTWVTPLIAAGAAIAAALVTALSAAYVARRKVAEIQLTNSFELAKQYLESARNYTQNVYLPISIEVYELHDAFLRYKAFGKPSEQSGPGKPFSPRGRFENDCRLFIGATRERFYQGAGAVLTVRLDDDLTAFKSFLEESLAADEVVEARSAFKTIGRFALTAASIIMPVIGTASSISSAALLAFGTGSTTERQVSAAPVMSDKFEEQFGIYITSIKAGIKQVTLGGYAQ
jgi:hypothetical protein